MEKQHQVSISEVVPVPSERVNSSRNGELIVVTLPRIRGKWARKIVAPILPLDKVFRLEEHGSAVWELIDGRRSVKEILSLLESHFKGEKEYEVWVITYITRLHKDGLINYTIPR